MDVAFYDPFKSDGYDKALGVRRVEKLDHLLAQSFALSVHCPLTPIRGTSSIRLLRPQFDAERFRIW